MCINSACENIRNPSIHPAVHAARRRGALRGLGNLRAPQQWPWRARCPPARGWAAVCLFVVPPVTWDPLSALLTQEERGDLPAKGRAPCLPPPCAPRSSGAACPGMRPRSAAAAAPAPPRILTSGRVFLGRLPLEAAVALQHGWAHRPAPACPDALGPGEGVAGLRGP